MSKITSKEIIDLSGIEAEIASLEKANKALAELQAQAVTSANSIKASMSTIGAGGKSLVQLQAAAKKANSSFKSLQTQISNNAANIKSLQSKLNGTRAALGKFQSNAVKAANGAKQLAGATQRASGGMGKFTKSANRAASSLSRWATGLLGIHLVTQYGREIIKLGIDMDRLDFTYKTLIRDQSEYAQAMAFTSKIANDYGVSIVEVRDSFIKFKAAADAANISGSETEEMFDTFTKTSAVLGLSTEKAGLALRALSQIAAKGTVQMEELRGQLGEQIPGAVSLMAEGMGIALGEFEKLVAKGEIASKDALPALAKQMKITFGLDLVENIDNAQSAVGRLNTAWAELVASLDTGEAIKIVSNALTVFIKFLKNNANALIAVSKAVALVVPVYLGFTTATTVLTTATKLLTRALILSPWGIVIGAVTLLTGAFYALAEAEDATSKSARENATAAGQTATALEDLNKKIKESKGSREDLKKIIDEVNKLNPDILHGLELERVAHEDVSTAIENHINALSGLKEGQAIIARISEINERLGELGELAADGNLSIFGKGEAFGLKKELAELEAARRSNANKKRIADRKRRDDEQKDLIAAADEKAKLDEELRAKRLKEAEAARKAKEAERERERKEAIRIEQLSIDLLEEGLEKTLRQLKLNYDKKIAATEGYYDIQNELRKKFFEDQARITEYYAKRDSDLDSFQSLSERTGASREKPTLYRNVDELPVNSFTGSAENGTGLSANQQAELLKKINKSAKEAKDRQDKEEIDAEQKKKEAKLKIATEFLDESLAQAEKLAAANRQFAEEELRRADQKVSTATAELAAQVALADAGYAANVGDAQRKLELEKKNQADALKQKEKAQKKEAAINTASEISNLIAAAAKLWVDPGFPAALPAIGIMFASYAASKIAARAIAGKKKFADGGLEIIGGGSHASGNDTPLGFSVGGREAYAEKGEAHMIVSAKNTAKYKDILPEIERGLNSGTFEAMLNANVSPSYSITHSVDMSQVESHLFAIRKNGEKNVSFDRDGNEIHRYKNTITRVIN